MPKENGVVPLVKENPVLGAGNFVSPGGLPKPVKTDVDGLSSDFKPKLKPFVLGGEVAVAAAAAAAASWPPKKKPCLGESVLLLAAVVAGLTPKLKMLAGEAVLDVASDLVGVVLGFCILPKEKSGAVTVVVVPPLVIVQFGFLPKDKDGKVVPVAVVVVGLPKKKPAAGAVVANAAAAGVIVGGFGVTAAAVVFVVGAATVVVSAFVDGEGVFVRLDVALLLASSFCRNSFAYLS